MEPVTRTAGKNHDVSWGILADGADSLKIVTELISQHCFGRRTDQTHLPTLMRLNLERATSSAISSKCCPTFCNRESPLTMGPTMIVS